ncbi:porin [Enterobacteriaceae bacterium C34A]
MSAFIQKGKAVKPAAFLSLLLSPCELYAAELYHRENTRLELLGEINGQRLFTSDREEEGDDSFARFALIGEASLTENLTGYGAVEYKVHANGAEDNDGLTTELAFAGITWDSRISVDYGRNEGLLYDTAAGTDVLPVFGNDTYTETDNFMAGRAGNLVTLRTLESLRMVEGLDFAVQYQGKNSRPGDPQRQNGHGWGTSVNYATDFGLSVGAVYVRSDRTEEQKNTLSNQASRADAWATSLKYEGSSLYFAATWGETHNMTTIDEEVASKTRNVEVVTQYQFDSGLRPSIAWLQSVADTEEYKRIDRVKYLDLALFYDLNDNFTLFADYKVNMLHTGDVAVKEFGLSTDNIMAVGMAYTF